MNTTQAQHLSPADRAVLAIAFQLAQAAPHAERMAARRVTERIVRHVAAAAECAARQRATVSARRVAA